MAARRFARLEPTNPAKLARALVTLVDLERPPLRFMAGADAIATGEKRLAELREQIDAYRDLSSSLAFSAAGGTGNGS